MALELQTLCSHMQACCFGRVWYCTYGISSRSGVLFSCLEYPLRYVKQYSPLVELSALYLE
ncbi:hypothetical protein GOP47_0010261 [Adiantum capillus-veneris]|uniref:Uncharacterized protein n=1 Tax=Adiantum capillus-veneris TaxID=13818 RepID=A0A9D4UUY3_ADICA|nr:hypothetical protein GOP47_0010261 [Adiantum capillus-veneris]